MEEISLKKNHSSSYTVTIKCPHCGKAHSYKVELIEEDDYTKPEKWINKKEYDNDYNKKGSLY